NGDTLTFQWTQTAGTSIALAGPDRAQASFTAPTVTAPTRLTFEVQVGDGHAASKDHVDVMVLPLPAPADQGGCNAAGPSPAPSGILLLFALLALRRRRSQ